MLAADERLAEEICFAYLRLEQEINNVVANARERLGDDATRTLANAFGEVLAEFGDRVVRPTAVEHPTIAKKYGLATD